MLGAEHCFGTAGNAVPCVVQIEGSAYIRNLTTLGLRCASKGFETDLCAMGDEVGRLRKVVASQEARIAKQEARMTTLERALATLLGERQQSESFNGARSPVKSDVLVTKTDDSDAVGGTRCCAGAVVVADCRLKSDDSDTDDTSSGLKFFGWYRTHFSASADLAVTGPHSNIYQAVDAGADTAALAAAKAAGQATLLAVESLFPGIKTNKPDFKSMWEPAVPVLRKLLANKCRSPPPPM